MLFVRRYKNFIYFYYITRLRIGWAGPSGRAVQGVDLRPLTNWDCGFESRQGAWMCVCCECCVLSGTGLCNELITHPEKPYQLLCVWVWSWILDNKETLAHWGLLDHGKIKKKKKKKRMGQATNFTTSTQDFSSAITLKLFPTVWWHEMHTYLLPNFVNYFKLQLLCYLWYLYFV